ncbi:MAG: hypothetical protein K6C32_03820 [Bacilli bacterium]|nr:hypothetical protein [Bacilli bacterium]
MRTNKRITIGLISLACLTSAALIGTAAGSLAWYAYSRTGTVSYRGTSVSNTALLNVGIVDDGPTYKISAATITQYGLTRESIDNHSIVFCHSTNGLDYRVIQEYLSNSTYAVDTLSPITTQVPSYDASGNLIFYKSPEYGQTNISSYAAEESDYVKLPFAFRVGNANNEGIVSDDIWLTGCSVQASAKNIHEAVRIHLDNGTTKFIMKPANKTTSKESTKLGGLLDLDGDGTYDYDDELKECYYGLADNAPTYASSAYGPSTQLDNVNGVSDTSEASTFLAKHNERAKAVTNIATIGPKVVENETYGTVTPLINTTTGAYYAGATGKPITTTSAVTGVGYATFTIYIEGWDHSVIDQASGYDFNLDLKFEINKTN